MNRDIFLMGDINNKNIEECIAQMLLLDLESEEDITLYISSNGGSIIDGLSLIEVMSVIKSKVRTVVIDKAFSMGAVILACGDERIALENSFIMIHEALGNIKNIENVEYYFNLIIEILHKRTNKRIEDIREACSFDNFLTAKEALEMGLIDKVV